MFVRLKADLCIFIALLLVHVLQGELKSAMYPKIKENIKMVIFWELK